jgi:choline-glycine betaine transporter
MLQGEARKEAAMKQNRMFNYLIAAAAVAAVLIAVGVPLVSLLPVAVLLACPLMMVFMMRGMSGSHGSEDHTGHACEHDPTRKAEPPIGRAR